MRRCWLLLGEVMLHTAGTKADASCTTVLNISNARITECTRNTISLHAYIMYILRYYIYPSLRSSRHKPSSFMFNNFIPRYSYFHPRLCLPNVIIKEAQIVFNFIIRMPAHHPSTKFPLKRNIDNPNVGLNSSRFVAISVFH